jgi:hypothetical protein
MSDHGVFVKDYIAVLADHADPVHICQETDRLVTLATSPMRFQQSPLTKRSLTFLLLSSPVHISAAPALGDVVVVASFIQYSAVHVIAVEYHLGNHVLATATRCSNWKDFVAIVTNDVEASGVTRGLSWS